MPLGFAGVLVGLSVGNLRGWSAHAGAIVAGLAAFFEVAGHVGVVRQGTIG